ncbi:MAG: DUF4347 domain-containing protein, partial [Planctomycetota bacterium]
VRMVADTSVNTPNRGQQNAREVLIIDQSVENYQQLMDDVLLKRGNVDVLLLDADDPDGIGQLRRLLAPYQDLNALHIVSHGTEDGIMLGQTHLTVDSLSAHAGDIAAWGQSLATGGDIMIYGCDLAGSADGRELLQSLRTLTGADIAASDDDTGLAARGGDWDMEYILGQTETSIVFSDTVRENWDGLLAPGPSVQLSAGNRSPQIGSDVQFTATFDNTAPAGSGDTGYGPFIDLLFPVDGVDGNGGEDTADGLKFKSASYLNSPVQATTVNFTDTDGSSNDQGNSDVADDTGTSQFGFAIHPLAESVQNELQVLQFSGQVGGGTLSLSFGGQTRTIDLGASGGQLTTAALTSTLHQFTALNSSNINVTQPIGHDSTWLIEFVGDLAQTDQDQITVDNSNLVGPTVGGPRGQFTTSTIISGDDQAQATRVLGNVGDQLVVLELPFGSVTPDQPAIEVVVNAEVSELADLHTAARPETELKVRARSGFRFGADELDNPANDPVLLSDTRSDANAWSQEIGFQPTLLNVTTRIDAHENETATGPNYPRTFVIDVDIPEGQTIENLDISDLLPSDLVFLSLTSLTSTDSNTSFTTNVPSGTNVLGQPSNQTSFTGSNGRPALDITGPHADQTLVVSADRIVGESGNDIRIQFTGYIDQNHTDAAGDPTSPVISSNGEDDQSSSVTQHQATVLGDWIATDTRDRGAAAVDNASATSNLATLDDKSITVRKNVTNTIGGSRGFATPDDILRYDLTFQISDYFTFGDLVLTDVFSDGQRFYNAAGFAPTFSITDQGNTWTDEGFNVYVGAETTAISPNATDNFIVDQSEIDNSSTENGFETGNGTYVGGGPDPTDGTTSVRIELSERLRQLGEDGILQGALTHDGAGNLLSNRRAAATGAITFYTQLQEEYSDTFPSGDRSIDHDDQLTNDVTITGNVHQNAENGPITQVLGNEQDTSSASISVEVGTLTKAVYAVNGNTNLPSQLRLQPGDDITYRLTYTLPNSDFEELVLTDFFPLPALVVDDFNADNIGGDTWRFDDNATLDYRPGYVELGPNDTFYRSNVGASDFFDDSRISINTDSNSLRLDFGSYDDDDNRSTQIDLLVTATLQDDPFADGLFLTNLARAEYGSTNQTPDPADAIVQISLGQPVLGITKGIIATDGDGVFSDSLPTVQSEVQTLTFSGTNLGETFRLTFQGQTTGEISVRASARQIKSSLEALSNVNSGDVIVNGSQLNNSTIEIGFVGQYEGTNVGQITAVSSTTANTITSATVIAGGTAFDANSINGASPLASATIQKLKIDSDIREDAQAGDTFTFMIVVENTGSGANGAFDVQVRDILPDEFQYVAGTLSVQDGTGQSLGFTSVGSHPDHALFGSGIQFNDPGNTGGGTSSVDAGALDQYSLHDGRNIAVIKYQAKLVDTVALKSDNIISNEEITNTAVLASYAGREGGSDHTANRNEVQALSAAGTPTSGTFQLSFQGQTTAPIAHDADADAIATALLALSNISAGSVDVSGTNLAGGDIEITFLRELGGQNVQQIAIVGNSLMNGGSSVALSTHWVLR